MKIVDATNPIPKYLQISAWLKELIQNGRYRPGEKLPSEVELSQVCGVNRNTLRQAISELAAIGLLRKEKGTGTFVETRAPVELRHKLERILSFTDLMHASGVEEKTNILSKRVEIAGEDIARWMADAQHRSSADAVREALDNAEAAGCEEAMLSPVTAELAEIDRLADLLARR